jgi:pilus assembly protein CpaF
MMMQMAGFELPIRAMRQQISLALDVIVHTARMNDGTRKVTSITEVVGMEGDTVMLQDLFVFQREGVDEHGRITGRYTPTGIRPRFADNLKATGQAADAQAFDYLRN